MIKLIIIFTTLFSLDNLLVLFLPIQPLVGHYIMVPSTLLMGLCLFAFYEKGKRPLIFAGVLGVLYDLYFTGAFGVYTCIFLISVYVLQQFVAYKIPVNFISMMAIMAASIIFQEVVVYFLVFTMTDINTAPMHFVQYILFASLFLNLFLLMILYPVLTKQFKKYSEE